mmetsp:Transcript_23299/g.42855  ORF Transcript_23299/g.42855 Transcript_23299/m.42855 type:complete len:231 (+) Transcript_23299:157-849(+)
MGQAESSERQKALALVKQHSFLLGSVPEPFKIDREVVLAAVQRSGGALQYAAEELKADREVVLVAVQQSGVALQHATEEVRHDREVVLAAVQQNGVALEYAAEELKCDRGVVLAAASENPHALNYAAEALLLDPEFAREAKERCYIFKVSLLSGRCIYAVGRVDDALQTAESFLASHCCSALGLEHAGTEALIHGEAVVPKDAEMPAWPGIQPPGEISEYQLVVGVGEPE